MQVPRGIRRWHKNSDQESCRCGRGRQRQSKLQNNTIKQMPCHTLSVYTVREVQRKDQFRGDWFFLRAYHRISELEGTLLKQGHLSKATHNYAKSCPDSLHNLSGQPAFIFWLLLPEKKLLFLMFRWDSMLGGFFVFFFFLLLACHWALPRSTLPRRAWLPHFHLLTKHLWYLYTLIRSWPSEFQTFSRLKSSNSQSLSRGKILFMAPHQVHASMSFSAEQLSNIYWCMWLLLPRYRTFYVPSQRD